MFPDHFYEFIFGLNLPWIVIAIGYSLLDYTFNLTMCSIVGGGSVAIKYIRNNIKFPFTKVFLNRLFTKFKAGSLKYIKEFQTDKLSWLWPVTSLLIPTYIYGATKELVESAVLSLNQNGVEVINYIVLPNGRLIEILFWLTALSLSIRTFYRYQRERSKPTWFSRIWIFSFIRSILFDMPLAYMILGTIYTWAQYSTLLFRILTADQIQYTILHPDLMYGLGKAYTTVIAIGLLLLILSLIPSFMFVREKQEKYYRMYFILMYTGILTLFSMLGILVSKFDQRLSIIKESALQSTQLELSGDTISELNEISNLQYFSVVSNLPGNFPVPSWLSLLFSARSAIFLVEFIRVISPTTLRNSGIYNLVQKILSK